MVKGDPTITRCEPDQAMLSDLKRRAESLAQQLSWVGRVTIGVCKHCGDPVNSDRLSVLPDPSLCIQCAQSGEA
jgi:RNA polymerase-binding transcription factor DksA